MTLEVKKVGIDSGFCREYFKDADGNFFVLQEESLDKKIWYSASENFGEPEFPIKKEVCFLIVESFNKGRVTP